MGTHVWTNTHTHTQSSAFGMQRFQFDLMKMSWCKLNNYALAALIHDVETYWFSLKNDHRRGEKKNRKRAQKLWFNKSKHCGDWNASMSTCTHEYARFACVEKKHNIFVWILAMATSNLNQTFHVASIIFLHRWTMGICKLSASIEIYTEETCFHHSVRCP